MLSFTATPVGIIIPEIRETMDLLPEIIHTENIATPVPEMIMAQCQEDTGEWRLIKKDENWDWISYGPQFMIFSYYLVTAIVMVEAGNPEAIWTVQVVAPTEIHMMVTVSYDSH